jgi:hypothetical protein
MEGPGQMYALKLDMVEDHGTKGPYTSSAEKHVYALQFISLQRRMENQPITTDKILRRS